MTTPTIPNSQLFAGIKVLAVARVVAAPFCAMHLAVNGADVITIENPEEDAFRHAFAKKLSAKGWLFPTLPVEYGGGGLSKDHYYVLDVEIGRYGLEGVLYLEFDRMLAPAFDHQTGKVKPCPVDAAAATTIGLSEYRRVNP